MGQKWSVSAEGGYFANPELSKKLRSAAQPMTKFRQFVRAEPGFGKGKGDTLYFNKVSNIQDKGGKLQELVRIPASKFLIRQGSVVVDEWGNSIPYTGKLEALSEFDLTNPIQRALRDDMAKSIDIAVATAFKLSKTCYIPTGAAAGSWDNDGTPTASATSNLTLFHIKEIVDALRSGVFGANTYAPVAPYSGPDGDYIGLFSVKAARGIKDDPEFEEWAKYTQADRLFKGEIGRIYGVRVIETNHLDALSNGVGTNSVLGEALIFGEDPVVEAVAVPEELRAKIAEDYGRDKGVAWYALLGWNIVWDATTDGETRVVRVTSS